MKRIRWSPAAADDLEQIRNYQAEHHPSRAQSTISALYQATRSLQRFPYRGRNGEVAGTRELMIALPYVIVYGVESQAVNIFRVLHSAQA